MKSKPTVQKRVTFILMIALITFIVLEIIIRLTGQFYTYTEKTSGKYYVYYGQKWPSWYWTHKPNTPIIYNQPEIKCTYPGNSIGLREREVKQSLTDSTKRLFVIGDSFTEGDGVDYYHSMPRFLEKKLDSAHLNIETYNFGNSGSDPFFEYTLLRDKVLPYKPTNVIMCINQSDITDYIFRGGMERFLPDGTTQFRPGPWWKPLFRFSHLFRLYISATGANCNNTFLNQAKYTVEQKKAYAEIVNCIAQAKQLCDEHHVKLMIAVMPTPNDIEIDFNCLLENLADTTASTASYTIDLFKPFKNNLNNKNIGDYSLKINGHYNEKGYHVFADILFDTINKKQPDFWK